MARDRARWTGACCTLVTVVALGACGVESDPPAGGTPRPSGQASATVSATASPTASATASPSPSTQASASPSPSASVAQDAVVARLPGPADGSCVTADGRNFRSGGIGAGDFSVARREYKAGGTGVEPATVTLNVIPAHPGSMSGVKMTMTRLRKPVYTYDHTSTTTRTESGVQFYELVFSVQQPGSWRLKIVAGQDAGCFDVAFNRPG